MPEAVPSTAPQAFHFPPILTNAEGTLRRAGFEFEFAGLDIDASAKLLQRVFGGHEVIESPAVRKIVGTPLGDFTVEIDSAVLKDKGYESVLRAVGLDPQRVNMEPLEKLLVGLFSTWVPFEVSTPPIPINELHRLDELRELLYENGAKGTRASFRYGFGMHINAELTSTSPAMLRDHLRAFFLLMPWLKDRVDVNLTRRILPFINPFPASYIKQMLHPGYPDDAGRLIDDYIMHNPTRNRPLDMLPALAWLDKQRVMDRIEEPALVKPRPAFHYRLPNCLVDEPQWTIAREWNTWIAVERLANDPETLAAMSADYLAADETSFRPFIDKWPNVLQTYLESGAVGSDFRSDAR